MSTFNAFAINSTSESVTRLTWDSIFARVLREMFQPIILHCAVRSACVIWFCSRRCLICGPITFISQLAPVSELDFDRKTCEYCSVNGAILIGFGSQNAPLHLLNRIYHCFIECPIDKWSV